jgi:hypothetical protein
MIIHRMISAISILTSTTARRLMIKALGSRRAADPKVATCALSNE